MFDLDLLDAGFLESLDDFYLMDSGLAMLQTTNSVFNQSLFKLVTSSSVLAWQRVRVANMMASSGRQWSQTFAKYNSGEFKHVSHSSFYINILFILINALFRLDISINVRLFKISV